MLCVSFLLVAFVAFVAFCRLPVRKSSKIAHFIEKFGLFSALFYSKNGA